MAAPQVTEVIQKVSNKILVYFDGPLDDSVDINDTSFSLNYGRIPITGVSYYGTAAVLILIDKELTSRDKVELNYQPPETITSALRGAVGPEPSNIVIRRNAVRAFYKLPVKNLIRVDENNWTGNSNLGGGKQFIPDPNDPEGGGDVPSFDICGDGSIIIGGLPDGNGTGDGTGNLLPVQAASGSTRSGKVDQMPYPNFTRPVPRTATPDDFVLAYGLKEAIQLSNIDDADAIQPNDQKIWMAIEDATALIDNYIEQSRRGGKLLISSNRRRTSLIIARYYLDTVRRREDIKDDYERAITELDKARSLKDVERLQPPFWMDPCGSGSGVRSHRIPQYYNGVTGKGLDGHWVDSASTEGSDYRNNYINSQNNNDSFNGSARGSSAPRVPEQPTDDGGEAFGGSDQS